MSKEVQMKSGGLWRQTTLVEHPKDFRRSTGNVQTSVGNFRMSAGNFQTNTRNLDEVMEFHPLNRKWDNHVCQFLVETYGGDTARDKV
jgi:hypothetical protein